MQSTPIVRVSEAADRQPPAVAQETLGTEIVEREAARGRIFAQAHARPEEVR